MAGNGGLTVEQARAASRATSLTTSHNDKSSPVYGNRKTAGEAHNKTSNSGGLKESGFMCGPNGKKKKY